MANEMQWSSLDAPNFNPCGLWQAVEGLTLDDEDAFHLEVEIEIEEYAVEGLTLGGVATLNIRSNGAVQ